MIESPPWLNLKVKQFYPSPAQIMSLNFRAKAQSIGPRTDVIIQITRDSLETEKMMPVLAVA